MTGAPNFAFGTSGSRAANARAAAATFEGQSERRRQELLRKWASLRCFRGYGNVTRAHALLVFDYGIDPDTVERTPVSRLQKYIHRH
jgi:hypothetical protein